MSLCQVQHRHINSNPYQNPNSVSKSIRNLPTLTTLDLHVVEAYHRHCLQALQVDTRSLRHGWWRSRIQITDHVLRGVRGASWRRRQRHAQAPLQLTCFKFSFADDDACAVFSSSGLFTVLACVFSALWPPKSSMGSFGITSRFFMALIASLPPLPFAPFCFLSNQAKSLCWRISFHAPDIPRWRPSSRCKSWCGDWSQSCWGCCLCHVPVRARC